ncbi:MAG: acetate kinase [Bacteroidales bacterium]|nr:acetate kinase [Candidatus Sodaliphilus fimicaballi]
MNILVLNCGSSSVKYKLIEIKANKTLAEGGVEKIGLPDAFIKLKFEDGSKKEIALNINDHVGAIKSILDVLTNEEYGCIKSFDEIDAVGHRVVHGGEKFSKSMLITDEVKAMIKECYGIAPLHNPVNMQGIEAIDAVLPSVPQVAVFDTAFHQTMPAKAYRYALPEKYYTEDHVRRYGFHGTSHRFVASRVCEMLGVDPAGKKIICCHIGNGASITAIKDGKSIDTSMGLTPTEGLMMGTRAGDVDPGALLFLMEKYNLSAKDMLGILNKESGVMGVTGISSDMREIVDAAEVKGDKKAQLALDMYELRILKYIGAYAAELNGVDIIAFTGGVGENQFGTRKVVCRNLEYLGVKIDDEVNDKTWRGKEGVISTPDSKVKVVVVMTDEEYMIAHDTEAIVEGREP